MLIPDNDHLGPSFTCATNRTTIPVLSLSKSPLFSHSDSCISPIPVLLALPLEWTICSLDMSQHEGTSLKPCTVLPAQFIVFGPYLLLFCSRPLVLVIHVYYYFIRTPCRRPALCQSTNHITSHQLWALKCFLLFWLINNTCRSYYLTGSVANVFPFR